MVLAKEGVEGKTSPKPLTSEGRNLRGKLLEVRSPVKQLVVDHMLGSHDGT